MSSCPRGGVQTWRPQGGRFASGLCPTACSCMNVCTRTAPTNMRCFPITATIMRSHWHARLVLGSGRNMPRPLGHRTCEGPAETCCIDCHACAHNAKSVRCVARVARLYSFLHADLWHASMHLRGHNGSPGGQSTTGGFGENAWLKCPCRHFRQWHGRMPNDQSLPRGSVDFVFCLDGPTGHDPWERGYAHYETTSAARHKHIFGWRGGCNCKQGRCNFRTPLKFVTSPSAPEIDNHRQSQGIATRRVARPRTCERACPTLVVRRVF